ncbi:hypothetical protein [Mameliella alba]|uniref:hypothetical protein n=1 Tax=Mameliella alba TaxID=561184 RepID=UPI00155661C7|nr:hypothetical protein [Mameliella alba]
MEFLACSLWQHSINTGARGKRASGRGRLMAHSRQPGRVFTVYSKFSWQLTVSSLL